MSMKSIDQILRYLGIIVVILLLPSILHSQDRYLLISDSSSVSVKGGSTLKDWSAEVGSMEGSFTIGTDSSWHIESSTMSFISKSLDGGRGPDMNAKIYKALDVENHDAIHFESLENMILSSAEDSELRIRSTGKLSIAGKSLDVTIDLTGTKEPMMLKGSHALKFSDYDITPPSALFGQIVCDDEMNITFDLHYNHDQ